MSSENKNQGRVAAGLKASIKNPNVSSEAKEQARERLDTMGAVDRDTQPRHSDEVVAGDEHQNRVLGGYKSTLATSGMDVDAPLVEGTSEDEHLTRVLAGYKAALHNDNVSDAAKQHAREVLEENGAL
ncbi:hypothetical protein OF83DRAFT_1169019 [Amylostereum chailletii]|nr:hypothetical protein OF83DRAFT_1169019 [Amylostereum chailletii]